MPSQNLQPAGGAFCPGCGEPVESDDRFCGLCGTELPAVGRAVSVSSGDRPTLAIGTPLPPSPPSPPVPAGPPGPQTPPVPPGTPRVARPGEPGAGGAGGAREQPRSRISALAEPSGPPPAGADSPTLAVRLDHRATGSGSGSGSGSDVQRSGTEPSFGPSAAGHSPASEASEGPAGPTAYTTGAGHLEASAEHSGDSGDFALQRPAPQAPAGPPVPPGAAPGEPGRQPEAAAAAPDPRTAGPAPGGDGRKLCVACRAGRVDTDGYCENCGHAQPRERDHMEQELDTVAAVSDRGLRHHRNEDAFAVSATALADGSPAVVAIVCDGVSSATRPDEASQAAARTACDVLVAALPRGTHPQQAMRDAIVAAAASVNALAAPGAGGGALDHDTHPQQNAPACTIVGAVSAGELLIVGWVGDSRAYWVPDDRSGPPARLTEDDSWAAQMVAAGLMNEAEAYADERAHAITGWLGADAYELDPHTAAFKPDRPGVVVVCTDGLWNYAEAPEEMARVIPSDAARWPLHSARALVGHALDGGGHDNVTVAVLPFAVGRQTGGAS
ncbi:PP2C family serine/threonine-protein phosphatase [Streptomyces qinzhouensis]|uniref:Phosphatase n=1 Tax=Streptomyces qinzhouensis TaxID=2599401 RepID=A0A5B8J670_9ACTN|nr:PP2C family serine/threonine-protein phosphatase [Streptomyces qinzhouensis]QDY76776.1 phosphatase [Streptomyces qinzhouensis]